MKSSFGTRRWSRNTSAVTPASPKEWQQRSSRQASTSYLPGKRACPYHLHHAQEEMFVILEGTGTLRVAGEMLPVKAGDVVVIPPGRDYPHQLINTSSQVLKYLAIGTTDEPEICEYPDSGKYLAEVGVATAHPFGVIGRTSTVIDYWEGEK